MNGDGEADVLVAHGGWNALGVYLQTAGVLGSEMLEPIPYASHYNPHGLAVGDIDSDGRPDVVLADYNNGLVILRHAHPPTITGFTPTSGGYFASVQLTGTGFTGATDVRFNGTSAAFSRRDPDPDRDDGAAGIDDGADQRDDTRRDGDQRLQLHRDLDSRADDHELHSHRRRRRHASDDHRDELHGSDRGRVCRRERHLHRRLRDPDLDHRSGRGPERLDHRHRPGGDRRQRVVHGPDGFHRGQDRGDRRTVDLLRGGLPGVGCHRFHHVPGVRLLLRQRELGLAPHRRPDRALENGRHDGGVPGALLRHRGHGRPQRQAAHLGHLRARDALWP